MADGYMWDELPPLRGLHFMGPRDSHKWTEFVGFLRDPVNGITIHAILDTAPGEYRCYVSEEDAVKIRLWFKKENISSRQETVDRLNTHDV